MITQKSQFMGLFLIKSGLEFDLQMVIWLDFQVGQRQRSWLLIINDQK